jgi:hypothetical protein
MAAKREACGAPADLSDSPAWLPAVVRQSHSLEINARSAAWEAQHSMARISFTKTLAHRPEDWPLAREWAGKLCEKFGAQLG